VEASMRRPNFDSWSKAGIGLYLAGSVVLLVVMHALGRLWTVKLIFATDHALSRHWVFGVVRHPNYYLAIVPELAGLALCMHAWVTLALLGPLYLIPLRQRIEQENAVMERSFPGY
jgi:isoprenylcysteine carboxyl methyltransferase (ICMT) family protein YpbQ